MASDIPSFDIPINPSIALAPGVDGYRSTRWDQSAPPGTGENGQGTKRGLDGAGGDIDLKRQRGQGHNLELRVLLGNRNAGSIIGRGGTNLSRLRQEYKAQIQVPESNGPERVLSIGSNLGTVCEVLLDVFPKMEEYCSNGTDLNFDIDLRMLMHQNLAGGVIGKGGCKIKELRAQTTANIKVYSVCAPQSTDRVVQLTGRPKPVINCLGNIMEMLEGDIVSRYIIREK